VVLVVALDLWVAVVPPAPVREQGQTGGDQQEAYQDYDYFSHVPSSAAATRQPFEYISPLEKIRSGGRKSAGR
jgi:hypothetical protein